MGLRKKVVPKWQRRGYCRECGEVLTGLKQRWCSTKCATRVYGRARTIAMLAYSPLNEACKACRAKVTAGQWFCGPTCRATWREMGEATPSRYERAEFFKRR